MSDVIQATVEIAEPEIKVVNEVPTRGGRKGPRVQ